MRIARLDGVRALAILLVLASHGLWIDIGWTGVDLFFVLSGFLITGILRRSHDTETFWSTFYIKRATRIVPALLICFAATALIFSVPWAKIWPYYVLFGANIAETIFPGESYRAYPSLGVLWSLAVEEHFYFLWPAAIRYLNRSRLSWLCITILVGEPVLRGLATPYFSSFWPIYFLTPFRLDGLAAGCWLALLVEDQARLRWLSRRSGVILGVSFSILAVLVATGHFDRQHHWLFNSLGYSLVTLVAFSLIAHVLLCEQSWIARLLTLRPFTFTGRISYGLYLFHTLAIELTQLLAVQLGFPGHARALFPFSMTLAFGFSWVSFRFYEEPLIRWGHRLALRLRRQPPVHAQRQAVGL